MGENAESTNQKTETYEYSGSPAPFVTFLILTIVFFLLAFFGAFFGVSVFLWPVFVFLGVISLMLLPGTIAINQQ